MDREALLQVIVEPARQVGLSFEEGLAETILDDVAKQPGALPLLEYALLELWQRREHRRLTLDGYRASGGVQGAIRLWDVATGQPVGQPLRGHTNDVNSVAFSPDGLLLATGSDDQTVRLWDVASGQPIGQPLTGHGNIVHSVAFSPYGERLASAGNDGAIHVWDISPASWIAQACRRANRNLTSAEWTKYLQDVPYRKTCPDLLVPSD